MQEVVRALLMPHSKGFPPGGRMVRGTGIWPAMNPRPWNLDTAGLEPGQGVLIDPVAIAHCAAETLRRVGWPGISIMDQAFQLSLVDAEEATAAVAVEKWFAGNHGKVCDELLQRIKNANVDDLSPTARTAMSEAIASYRVGNYLCVVRVLFPEFEAFARGLESDKTKKLSQANAIRGLRDTIDRMPVSASDPLELFSLQHFIDDHLFAQCFTSADAQAFGDVPNRHAESHGFASYGTFKGAATLVCVMAYLMRLMDALKRLAAGASASPAASVT